jgi:hypothetical protein
MSWPRLLYQSRWGLIRLAIAAFVLWTLVADTGARLARLQLAAMPSFDYAAEVRHLRAAGRYGEALVIADAGLDATTGAEHSSIEQEKDKTRSEQASILRRLKDAGLGALSGQGDSLEGLVGAIAADMLVVGDVRDLLIQSSRYAVDGEADEVVIALSGLGLALTLAPEIDWVPSLLKIARKTGAMTRRMGEFVKEAAKARKLDDLKAILKDTRALSAAASPGGAIRLMRFAEEPKDLEKLARFVEREKTGAFALHVTEREGATLIKEGGVAAEKAVVLAARKGPRGVAWLRTGAYRALVRPHPLVGLVKGLWKGNVQKAVQRALERMDAHSSWVLPLLASWVLVECGLLGRRWRAAAQLPRKKQSAALASMD